MNVGDLLEVSKNGSVLFKFLTYFLLFIKKTRFLMHNLSFETFGKAFRGSRIEMKK